VSVFDDNNKLAKQILVVTRVDVSSFKLFLFRYNSILCSYSCYLQLSVDKYKHPALICAACNLLFDILTNLERTAHQLEVNHFNQLRLNLDSETNIRQQATYETRDHQILKDPKQTSDGEVSKVVSAVKKGPPNFEPHVQRIPKDIVKIEELINEDGTGTATQNVERIVDFINNDDTVVEGIRDHKLAAILI
jgi:hypothetical protein